MRRLLAGVLVLLAAAGFSPGAAAADGTTAPVSDNSAPAPPAPPSDNSAPVPPIIPDNNWVDRTHTYLAHNTLQTVQWFDNFFGDKYREEVAPAESTVRWRNNIRLGTDKTFTFRTDLRANVRLNKMSRKLRLVFSSETFDDVLGIRGDQTATQGVAASGAFHSSSSEVRYEMTKTARTEADIGVGALIKLPIVTYIRARYRYLYPLFDNNVMIRFSPTAFWRTHDGLGQSTVIDFEHRLSDATILRWGNSETTTQISSGMEWSSEPGILHSLKNGKAATFAVGMNGATRPAANVHTYYVLARYRQSVLREWLFAEVEPLQSWERGPQGGYHPVSAVTFRFEIFFRGTESDFREHEAKPD